MPRPPRDRELHTDLQMGFSFILVMFVLPAAIIATAVLLAQATKDRDV